MKFKKPCKNCEKLFRPLAKPTKLCDDCYKERMELRNQKLRDMAKRK